MKRRLVDPLIAVLLGAAYVALLLVTSSKLGYARDEGFYFQAAGSYEAWFDVLLRSPQRAFERAVVDRHWTANHEHPSLMKSLFALSHRLFYQEWHWFSEQGTAYRFPGMVVSALGVSVLYLWGRHAIGRLAGLVAALSFAFMPQTFFHSHLAAFDMPVAAMWLVTTYAYWRSLVPPGAGGGLRSAAPGKQAVWWAIAAGVLYGLLLDTKHNSWLLPGALVAHLVLTRGTRLITDFRRGRVRVPMALVVMLVVGPLVLYALWPWLWFDTGRRLAGWVAFHMGHEYYNMEFLGRTYWEPPMPLGYAWLMTLATVPAITLLIFTIGLASSLHLRLRSRLAGDPARWSTDALWLVCLLLSYAPWLSPTTPIFGGTKHWLTAYPFLCLFAARGFALVVRHAGGVVSGPLRRHAVVAAISATIVTGPIVMTLHAHPWGLSAYTPLVGGSPGAATLGLNRTFWGYTTGAVQDFLNQRAKPGTTVYVHDTALQSWDMMRADGRVRGDLHGSLAIHGSSVALYHHEPHMHRVEYQVWVDYGSVAPAHVGTYDGVPVVWVYLRP
jgi:4-amino-4-deoxy-L-arabinose transferase-like glycosyltransferase